MKSNLKRLFQQFAQAADALRFADAGEFLPIERKTALLGACPAPQPPRAPQGQTAARPARRIVLVAERRLSRAALRYAVNVCERFGADLDVLVGPELENIQEPVDRALEERGLHGRIHRLGADFLNEVASYAWTTSGLLFVVASQADGLAERVADRDGGKLGIPSQVPWVVVGDELAAA